MQIISATTVVMVGANPIGFPMPALPQGTNVQMNYLACVNVGGSDLYVVVGNNPGVSANSTNGTLVAAPTSGVQPGTMRPLISLEVGPVVALPVAAGNTYFSAVAAPTQTVQADTVATASNGATSLTVASATGIAIGQTVVAPGVPANTTVTAISGTTITISQATTAALSQIETQFIGVPAPLPPGILICAQGR